MELVAIARKAIRPHSASRSQASVAGGSHLVLVIGPASNEAPLSQSGAERDASRAALLLLEIPEAGLDVQHASNHQRRDKNGGTFNPHTGAHHQD